MKKNKKLHRNILIAILIMILILIILTIILMVVKNNIDPKTKLEDLKGNDVLNLSGFGIFFEQYTGEYKSSEIASHLENVTVDQLPQLYKDIKYANDNKLEKYYKDNLSNIKKYYGKRNLAEFLDFAKKVKKINTNLDNWYRLDVNSDSFINESEKKDYAYVEYTVSFKNDDTLNFSVYIAKKLNKNVSFIIDILQ